MDLDCRACGACCASPFDDLEPFVAVTVPDAARLGEAARALVVVDPRAASGLGLATVRPAERSGACARCAALEDEPDGRVRCAVYDARPDACRAVEPGGAYCLESRARRGLVSPGR